MTTYDTQKNQPKGRERKISSQETSMPSQSCESAGGIATPKREPESESLTEKKAKAAAYAREYRKTHPAAKRDRRKWSAQYRLTDGYRAAQEKYKASPHCKSMTSDYGKRAGIYSREKVTARWAVKSAIKAGRLIRPDTCEDCGKTCKPHGHHEDYSKPLCVNWLCIKCHCKRHPHGFYK